GQSKTVTVHADVGEVSNSRAKARLITPDGEVFGPATKFSVRSSVVGTIIWIGMAVAGVLVVAAVVGQLWRRVRNARRRRDAAAESTDSGDSPEHPQEGYAPTGGRQ